MQAQTARSSYGNRLTDEQAGAYSIVVVLIAFFLAMGLMLAADREGAPASITDPGPPASDALRVVPEPTGWAQGTVKVRTTRSDLKPFKNVLKNDIIEHGGFVVSQRGDRYTAQVSHQYLERLAPLAEASTRGHPASAHQAWSTLPNATASPDSEAVVEVKILVFTDENVRMAIWFWPALAVVIIVALSLLVLIMRRL